nr:HutD family protein [Sphingopyxis panaciterrae]
MPAAERIARPWRNGGGVTRDVAVFPPGAGDGDFVWRASIATIDTAGPFSAFPGVDRLLLPLAGALSLTIDRDSARRLQPGDPAFAFPGEAAVTGAPVGGACTVLNIMARRGLVRTQVEHGTQIRASADHMLLLATEQTAVCLGGERFDLAPHDALLLGAGDATAAASVIAALFCNTL